jgi:histidine triad (HIT) family protein
VNETTCLFCRIARGELPAKLVHEDDEIVAFHDINAQAPVHVLVVPRQHIASCAVMQDDDAGIVGRLFVVARDLAKELGIAELGYRLVINNGAAAGQTVSHIHLHVLGGRAMKWPPG